MTRRVVLPLVLTAAGAVCGVLFGVLGAVGSATASTAKSKINTSAPLYKDVPAQFKSGISVAIQVDAPPLSERTAGGKETGEDPELFAAMAKELGVPINVTATSFDNELLGLNAHKFDFVGQTNITTAREKIYSQVSQFKDGYRFVTLKANPGIGSTLMSLCGHTIAAEVGDESTTYLTSVSSQCTKAGKSPITLVQLPTLPDGYVAVASGRAQATVAPLSTTGYFLAKKGEQLGKTWKQTGPAILPILAGYTFPKGSPLVRVIAKAIQGLMNNGQYSKILTANDLKGDITLHALINPKPYPVPS